jgi:hypothetical protein
MTSGLAGLPFVLSPLLDKLVCPIQKANEKNLEFHKHESFIKRIQDHMDQLSANARSEPEPIPLKNSAANPLGYCTGNSPGW